MPSPPHDFGAHKQIVDLGDAGLTLLGSGVAGGTLVGVGVELLELLRLNVGE